MCNPLALAAGALTLQVAGTVAGARAQNKAAERNETAALLAEREASKDISLLQQQTVDQATKTIFETDRAARSTQALARVSAGEAGVSGISVEALLGDLDRKVGEFRIGTSRNLDAALAALQREKVSGRTVAQQRIANVQGASPFAVGLSLAGGGLAFWQGQIARNAATAVNKV